MDQKTIQDLSSTGSHQECLQACQQLIQSEPDNPLPWKYAGKSLLALGQFEKAQQRLAKAHQLDNKDPEIVKDIGNIFDALQNDAEAIRLYKAALSIDQNYAPAINNLGLIAKRQGKLSAAEQLVKKACDLDQSFAPYHINLGGIYKDLGNLDKALASTQKSLELKPEGSLALCKLGLIKMALGQTKEARRDLLISIKHNDQEIEAYYALSIMLETTQEAEEVIDLMRSIKTLILTPQARIFAEFALSNCFHKTKKYDIASKHVQLANKYKSTTDPSNADILLQEIALSTSHFEAVKKTDIGTNIGERRIFIVGMPRSGSTLLETILSMNPEIQELGESQSLRKAITKIKQQNKDSSCQDLNIFYSQMEPIEKNKYKYTTDKQLYNFMCINWITTYMPAAKIIHCRRNPLDNILSMHRSYLSPGNNYTANLEDAAKVLIAQEQAMQIQKKRYPEKIFTFDYDRFVNAPEVNLRKLLGWLDLEFDNNYLHPEKSTRSVNTASVMQARKPISNKSVGGWKNYENLLKPALEIVQESGIRIE